MQGIGWNVNDPQFKTRIFKQASQTLNAFVVGPGRTPDEEQVAKTEYIATVHTSLTTHRARLDTIELLHEEIRNRRLFGHARGMSGEGKQHASVDHNRLVLNEDAIRMVVVGIQSVDAHTVFFKRIDVGLMLFSGQ